MHRRVPSWQQATSNGARASKCGVSLGSRVRARLEQPLVLLVDEGLLGEVDEVHRRLGGDELQRVQQVSLPQVPLAKPGAETLSRSVSLRFHSPNLAQKPSAGQSPSGSTRQTWRSDAALGPARRGRLRGAAAPLARQPHTCLPARALTCNNASASHAQAGEGPDAPAPSSRRPRHARTRGAPAQPTRTQPLPKRAGARCAAARGSAPGGGAHLTSVPVCRNSSTFSDIVSSSFMSLVNSGRFSRARRSFTVFSMRSRSLSRSSLRAGGSPRPAGALGLAARPGPARCLPHGGKRAGSPRCSDRLIFWQRGPSHHERARSKVRSMTYQTLNLSTAPALVDDLQVLHGVHAVLHVHDVRVLKRAADVEDAVHRRDVGQERVAEALAGRRAPARRRGAPRRPRRALHAPCMPGACMSARRSVQQCV